MMGATDAAIGNPRRQRRAVMVVGITPPGSSGWTDREADVWLPVVAGVAYQNNTSSTAGTTTILRGSGRPGRVAESRRPRCHADKPRAIARLKAANQGWRALRSLRGAIQHALLSSPDRSRGFSFQRAGSPASGRDGGGGAARHLRQHCQPASGTGGGTRPDVGIRISLGATTGRLAPSAGGECACTHRRGVRRAVQRVGERSSCARSWSIESAAGLLARRARLAFALGLSL
jgi:hypothetical protein